MPDGTNGWQCPNCGSAHAPTMETCPVVKVYQFNDGLGYQCYWCKRWVPPNTLHSHPWVGLGTIVDG